MSGAVQEEIELSIVIPVFNSAEILPHLVEELDRFFREHPVSHEVIFVNDGSRDHSLEVLHRLQEGRRDMVVIDLMRNYGQHSAVYCGLEQARGRYVVTMDDDLQNPPSEIAPLWAKIREGYDVVFGRFRQKQHQAYRRWGSILVDYLNRKVFGKPPELVLSNFRIITRQTLEAALAINTAFPYIPGLLLLAGGRFANVEVEHRPRYQGRSGYNARAIAKLLWRLITSYSSWPLRVVSLLGAVLAVFALGFSIYVLVRALVVGSRVPGWASLALMLSLFQGISMIMLGAMGEYLVRLIRETSRKPPYFIRSKRGGA